MKWFCFRSLLLLTVCLTPVFSQENIAEKLTPEAIDTRIKEIRMGKIIIQAAPGAEVRIQQTRHGFLFGTAIPSELAEMHPRAISAEDRKTYLKILEANFNYAVHENALKWYECESEPGAVSYAVADRIWELCKERNIPMRGHCVYWEKEEFNSDWLKTLTQDELHAAMTRRGIDVVTHFKGRIEEFDLNNEMIHGDFFRRRLGYGVVNEMAWIVKAANPDAVLYVNDYGVLDMGFNAGAYIQQIQNLLNTGVPLGGIGCQGHLSMATTATTPSEKVQRNLDRLAVFNLPIKITECLFAYQDEKVQVEELERLFPIYFAHPNVEAILMWGFWAGSHWQPHCAMWKTDWTPRPQALAYQKLVYDKWWTQISDKTDSKGTLEADAFYGDYDITSGGITRKVTLKKEDGKAMVRF